MTYPGINLPSEDLKSKFGFHDEVIVINDNQPGSVARHLYEQLTDIQFGRAPDPFGWTHTIRVNGR